jgi:RHS repeat-associated protein
LGTAQLDEWGNVVQNTLPEVLNNYTNHEYDAVLGVYYAKARFYDPGNSRMMSVDPIKGNLINTQSLTAYIYVQSNPLKFIDPNGKEIIDVNVKGEIYHNIDTSKANDVLKVLNAVNNRASKYSEGFIYAYNYYSKKYSTVEIGAERKLTEILDDLGFTTTFASNAFYFLQTWENAHILCMLKIVIFTKKINFL